MLVVHDDVDLEVGRLQARRGEGSRATTDFAPSRSRSARRSSSGCESEWVDPGRGDPRDVADYVLTPFEAHDDRDAIVARAADAVETLLTEGLDVTQQRFN